MTDRQPEPTTERVDCPTCGQLMDADRLPEARAALDVDALARAVGVVEAATNTRLVWMYKGGSGDLAHRHLDDIAREYRAILAGEVGRE